MCVAGSTACCTLPLSRMGSVCSSGSHPTMRVRGRRPPIQRKSASTVKGSTVRASADAGRTSLSSASGWIT